MGIFTDTITIYNHKSDDTYQRTVIDGVMCVKKAEKTVTGDNKIFIATTVDVTIPDAAVCERTYVDKRVFRKMKDTSRNWTLDEVGNLDVIVCEEIRNEITVDYRLKQLKEDFDCATVTSVTDNRNRPRLKHMKVVCK